MRIFVPTGIHPSKNSSNIIYIKNILKNFDSVSCLWFLYQPQKIIMEKKSKEILEIHNYKNAVEVLEKIQPDCVITNNNKYAVVDYAFSLAAKFLNIPLINYKVVDVSEIENGRNFLQIGNNLKRNFKKIRSVDLESKEKRSSFIILKNKFLIETEKRIGEVNTNKMNYYIKNILFHLIGNPKKRFTNLADLQLVNTKIWWEIFTRAGIDEGKMTLTGNPYWDTLYNISKERKFSKEPITGSLIKILILTTPLLEHGHWVEEQRKQFLEELTNILKKQKDFDFSFKIHPSSEKMETYEKYFEKLNINAKIFQKESFWDIASNFDVIISYGYTTTHSEIALMGQRLILLGIGQNLREMPLVDSAIKSGFIIKCEKISDLPQTIKNIIKQKIQFHKNHEREIEKILYKFDGNSGKRAADAIKNIINNKKN